MKHINNNNKTYDVIKLKEGGQQGHRNSWGQLQPARVE